MKRSFRSNKHCLFPSQDPRCTFRASLSRISCNCDVPVSGAWLISEQTWAWRKERAKRGHWGALAKQSWPFLEVTQADTNVGTESGACCSPTRQGDQKEWQEWIVERSCCPSALELSFCPAELLLHHHPHIWVMGQQHFLQHQKYLPCEVPSFLLPPICVGKMRRGAWQEGMVGLYAALCSWQGKGKNILHLIPRL